YSLLLSFPTRRSSDLFLKPLAPVAIRSSPQPRARDTAAVLADGLGLSVEEAPAFDEIDYGDWTGRSFDALASHPPWRAYNSFRRDRKSTRLNSSYVKI